MSLGTKIQEARKKLNITQEQLADMLDVTRQSVSRWESDIAFPETYFILHLMEKKLSTYNMEIVL